MRLLSGVYVRVLGSFFGSSRPAPGNVAWCGRSPPWCHFPFLSGYSQHSTASSRELWELRAGSLAPSQEWQGEKGGEWRFCITEWVIYCKKQTKAELEGKQRSKWHRDEKGAVVYCFAESFWLRKACEPAGKQGNIAPSWLCPVSEITWQEPLEPATRVLPLDPAEWEVGTICFPSGARKNNRGIHELFQKHVVSRLYVGAYWNLLWIILNGKKKSGLYLTDFFD